MGINGQSTPKFDILAPPTPDTAKKVAAFLGVRRDGSKFTLEDIDSMVSKGKVVKKEVQSNVVPAVKPIAPRPEPSTAKPSSNKKRKISDPAELSIQDCTGFADAHRILHNLSHLKNKASKDKKLSNISRELAQVKAEKKEMLLQHARDIDESNTQAKASAAISIFHSRIKMAMEAEDKDFDRSTWDVEGWKRLVAELGGELTSKKDAGKAVAEDQVQGSKMVAEEHEVVDAGKQANQGDEGMTIYVRIIASVPNTKENGVWPVAFFEVIDDDLVVGFCLSIGLRMHMGRGYHLNSPASTEVGCSLTNELRSVITCYFRRDAESRQDIALDKGYNFFFSDLNKCLGFDPFGEVVSHC
ncbi:hypothetical protein L1987_64988 [Smallanthus sonchifolius]|uniref:Uncharacterized protein n=1 Tax=Smallanthus sonchifolius TaxID=185202 RepID=A0ACB9BT83_9ASTR|nr:hypothetical protein L1987_64988 [Smallanthus sonchifolius]